MVHNYSLPSLDSDPPMCDTYLDHNLPSTNLSIVWVIGVTITSIYDYIALSIFTCSYSLAPLIHQQQYDCLTNCLFRYVIIEHRSYHCSHSVTYFYISIESLNRPASKYYALIFTFYCFMFTWILFLLYIYISVFTYGTQIGTLYIMWQFSSWPLTL